MVSVSTLPALLDGEHTMDALVEEIRHHADNVPDDVSDHVTAFVDRLVAEGLAGLGDSAFGLLDATHRAVLRPEKCSAFPPGELSEGKQVTYEPPQLVNLSGHAQAAYGDCVNVGSHANNCTVNGHITCCCNANGTSAYQGAHGGITPCYGGCGAYYQGATARPIVVGRHAIMGPNYGTGGELS